MEFVLGFVLHVICYLLKTQKPPSFQAAYVNNHHYFALVFLPAFFAALTAS